MRVDVACGKRAGVLSITRARHKRRVHSTLSPADGQEDDAAHRPGQEEDDGRRPQGPFNSRRLPGPRLVVVRDAGPDTMAISVALLEFRDAGHWNRNLGN